MCIFEYWKRGSGGGHSRALEIADLGPRIKRDRYQEGEAHIRQGIKNSRSRKPGKRRITEKKRINGADRHAPQKTRTKKRR